jgi:hypothetical protein
MKVPAELARRLAGSSTNPVVALLSTSRVDGSSNVIPIPFTDIVDDELVLMPDLFAQKTKVNLNENRAAALSFATPEGALPWVLEGVADIIQWGHPRNFSLFGLRAGEVLERWGDWDETIEPVLDTAEPSARPTVFAQRGVIVFKPERIVEVSA